jgi:hypothetical protein
MGATVYELYGLSEGELAVVEAGRPAFRRALNANAEEAQDSEVDGDE